MMAKGGSYELEGVFHHLFYAPIKKKDYDFLHKTGEIEPDKLLELTEYADGYVTFFGADVAETTLTVAGGAVYGANELKEIAAKDTHSASAAGALVDFKRGGKEQFIIGHCVYQGTDSCEFKGKFDLKKLHAYMGYFQFEGQEDVNIEFFQIFYDGGEIQEGSEEDDRSIYIWSGKNGLTELKVL
jgi:hypothetical protein